MEMNCISVLFAFAILYFIWLIFCIKLSNGYYMHKNDLISNVVGRDLGNSKNLSRNLIADETTLMANKEIASCLHRIIICRINWQNGILITHYHYAPYIDVIHACSMQFLPLTYHFHHHYFLHQRNVCIFSLLFF